MARRHRIPSSPLRLSEETTIHQFFFSFAYHVVALFRARFAWSDAASLLIRHFCIPPADFLISLCFGFGHVGRVPPGVVVVVGVLSGVVVGIDGPPLTVDI